MLKWFGIMLILSAGGIMAYLSAEYEKKRLHILGAWCDLLRYIRSEIDCHLLPMDEILKQSRGVLSLPSEAEDLRGMLADTGRYLPPVCEKMLSDYLRESGTIYRGEQIKRCEYYLRTLEETKQKMREELQQKVRLSSGLCVCGALLLTVLLW